MERIKNWVVENHDLAFAILLAVFVYADFTTTEPLFMTHRTGFAIMERFAVLGLVGALIAGSIAGFFGYMSYGYLGMVGATVGGGVAGWIIATLIFYVLLSTTSVFN